MPDGTFDVALVGAIAAIAAVVVPIWRQQQRLKLEFTGGLVVDDGGIEFEVRATNGGRVAIAQIDIDVVSIRRTASRERQRRDVRSRAG